MRQIRISIPADIDEFVQANRPGHISELDYLRFLMRTGMEAEIYRQKRDRHDDDLINAMSQMLQTIGGVVAEHRDVVLAFTKRLERVAEKLDPPVPVEEVPAGDSKNEAASDGKAEAA